ncbi:hypothetical protein [Burkholderia multivorans]|uniref:hypothetical protein n=1 Tax=Burkholderia multivorans TaxID=87883 RepID=UPI0020A22390|nr:hypothetical protein [Burkholderia multivorans]MCO8320335.1 hypothetical protein [Burkholderia multivorans]
MRLTDLHPTTSSRLPTVFLALLGIVSLVLFAYLNIDISGFDMERVDDWLLREHAVTVGDEPPVHLFASKTANTLEQKTRLVRRDPDA